MKPAIPRIGPSRGCFVRPISMVFIMLFSVVDEQTIQLHQTPCQDDFGGRQSKWFSTIPPCVVPQRPHR